MIITHADILLYTYNNKKIINYIDKHLGYNHDREEFLHFLFEEICKIKLDYLQKSYDNKHIDRLLITICRNNIHSRTSTYYRKYIRDKKKELDVNMMTDNSYLVATTNDLLTVSSRLYPEVDIIEDVKVILQQLLPNYLNVNSKDWFKYKLFCHIYFEGYTYQYMQNTTGFSRSKLEKDLSGIVKQIKKEIKLKAI